MDAQWENMSTSKKRPIAILLVLLVPLFSVPWLFAARAAIQWAGGVELADCWPQYAKWPG